MTAVLLHKFMMRAVGDRLLWADVMPKNSATAALEADQSPLNSASPEQSPSPMCLCRGTGSGWTQRLGRWMGLGLVVGLASCARPAVESVRTWKVYQNPNYGFEFPYPDNWVPAPLSDSQDGRRFRNPYSTDVEILGWASHVSSVLGDSSEQVRRSVLAAPNFTTRQGLRGQLRVEIGPTVSLMTLTLTEDGVVYFWQGRSPSGQFSQYYEFFNYVARQYYVAPAAKPQTEK